MNIKINRKILLESLQKVIGPATGKTTFPIFSAVLIEFYDKKIRFISTDLELTVISQMDISDVSEGKESFCVSLMKLISILKEFSSLEVTLKTQKNFLWITCENCELKLNIINANEFPKLPVFKDKEVVRVQAEDLEEMIKSSSFSVFVGEGNYVLNGILCEMEKNFMSFISTDGKRLSVIKRRFSSSQPDINLKKSFILPHKSIIELSKVIHGYNGEVMMITGKKQAGFDLKDTQMITQLIEGEFPEYKKYIPKPAENKLKIGRTDFLSSLKRAGILSVPEYQGVKIELSKNKVTISKETPQLGEYKEEIEAEYSGKNLIFGFNPDYLTDVLKILESPRVEFDIYDVDKPVVLRSERYTYLALPMRLG